MTEMVVANMNDKHQTLKWEPSSSVYVADSGADEVNRHWHCREEFALHYFSDFSGRACVGDYVGLIKPNSLFLIAPNLLHSWVGEAADQRFSVQSPSDCLVLFPDEVVSRMCSLFPGLERLEGIMNDATLGIEFPGCPEVVEAGRMMLELNGMEGCARIGTFFSILDRLMDCEYRVLSSNPKAQDREPVAPENIHRAIAYIHDSYNETITLESAAEVANMSASHFCRVFKKTVGVGFVDFVNKVRVEQACDMLARTAKPISTIGYECGFTNMSNFNRNFRKHVNKAPSEFRADA